jgi:hypothetical protein
MHRIGRVLAVILLLPIIVSGAAWLMSWPAQDKLYYLGVGWVVGWTACYLAARLIARIVSWLTPPAETKSPHIECGAFV